MKQWKTIFLGLSLLGMPLQAALFDHSSYDTVLHRYVDADGLVDYPSVHDNSLSALESYFERLGDADLAGWPYVERVAFWINAYNARVLYLVAQKPKMKKISEDFELFNQPFKVAGTPLSLNDIKYRILRGTVNPDNKKGPVSGLTLDKRDPRINFTLADGTIDGPVLKNFAYTDENTEDTLEEDTKKYINASKHLEIIDGHLQISSLFKWAAKDFAAEGGAAHYMVLRLNADLRGDAEAVKDMLLVDFAKARYVYDWTLNAQQKEKPPLTDLKY